MKARTNKGVKVDYRRDKNFFSLHEKKQSIKVDKETGIMCSERHHKMGTVCEIGYLKFREVYQILFQNL